nr:uncharacterized protein LOC103350904 isoform X2 [Oryctolagus cuniculus]
MSSPPVRQPCLSFSDGGIYKPLLLHMLEKKGRLGLLQVMSPVQAVFNMPGAVAPYHQNMRLCPKMDVIYHYYLAASAAHVDVINPGIGYPVFWGPSPFVEQSYRRAEVLEHESSQGKSGCSARMLGCCPTPPPRVTNSQEVEEAAEDWTATDHGNAQSGPGVDAPYQHTVWACPEPEGGMDCYYLRDTAAAYAGAYPAGESYPLGWGPGRFAGRPYRRAQVVELPDTDTDTEEEAEQERAAPADAHEAPCGIEHLDVCYPSDCMHLGWPALVTHLYAAFGFPFHRFCCPALCLKQRHPWPRAVECESSQAKDLATPLSCWCLVPYHCLAVPSPGGSWPSCTPVHSWLPRVNPHGAADPCGGR